MKPLLKKSVESQGASESIPRPMPRGDGTPPSRVVPIASKGESIIPSSRDFELYRLEREIEHYKSKAGQLLDAIRHKNAKLTRWVHMAELGLQYDTWMSLGDFLHLVAETKSAIIHEGRMNSDMEVPSRARSKREDK